VPLRDLAFSNRLDGDVFVEIVELGNEGQGKGEVWRDDEFVRRDLNLQAVASG